MLRKAILARSSRDAPLELTETGHVLVLEAVFKAFLKPFVEGE